MMSQPSSREAIPAIGKAIAALAVAALAAGCGAVAASSNGAGSAPSASASATGGSATSGSATGGSGAAGTASAGAPSPVPTITATGSPVNPGPTQCANWPANVPSGPLPDSFVPVTVLRCVTGTKLIPGKGLFLAGTLQRADSNLGTLVAALHASSGHRKPGMMCPMIAMLPQHIVLIAKDGSMISPNIPVDACGTDQVQVIAALNSLSWQTLSVRLYSMVPGSGHSPSPSGPDEPSDPVHGGMNGSPAVNSNH